MVDLHFFISNFSYLAIFLLMVANGVSNIPSSQLLYIACGYFVATSSLLFIPTIIAGALGNTIGNIITFLLVKKYDITFAQKILMLDAVTFAKIHKALHQTFTQKGMWYIFIGKLTPSIKAFIPVIAGLAKTSTKLTSFIFLIASLLWACMITSLGYFFGEHASISSLSGVSFVIGATILFLMYRAYKKQTQ